jgi:ATP-dependent helicase/DNAse subunit B
MVYNVAMTKDKYAAVWVSHSSISDFLTCPRAYYLNNIYRNPKTGHKVKLMSPPLALGQAVHEVIESLSVLPTESRFHDSLLDKFETAWKKVTGKRGGFFDSESEARYKKRGEDMMRRVMNNPGPLKNLAVKISMDLPYYWLSDEENIILCGKIDWLEYLAETDSVHIIDFKTSKGEEDDGSLQLAIYALLVTNCQKRKPTKASYWYLDRHDYPLEKKLPPLGKSEEKVLKVAKDIKLARQLERFVCPTDGCRACVPLEQIFKGAGELVGTDDFGQDIFVLNTTDDQKEDSRIL